MWVVGVPPAPNPQMAVNIPGGLRRFASRHSETVTFARSAWSGRSGATLHIENMIILEKSGYYFQTSGKNKNLLYLAVDSVVFDLVTCWYRLDL